jgi:5-(carboxyamino)imidazole ribonucleotide mutase
LISVNNAHIAVVIAGAGGAAHLPGMVVLCLITSNWVPVKSSNSIDGWDSVLSILQMPGGVSLQLLLNGAKKCWNLSSTNYR